ncbi:diacylglycerol/lipid kinase family protein [Actinophytocola sediminis]
MPGAPERVLIIANPAAGNTSVDLVWQVIRGCRRPVSVRWTDFPGSATAIAETAANWADLVVSVGGDGTAREVVAGLATAWRPVPMLVVPGGTANSLYRTLWGRMPWRAALAMALAGLPAHRLDLARLDGGLVLTGASAGFTPMAVHDAKTGGLSYQEAIRRVSSWYRPYPGRVLVDGHEIHSGSTFVVNVGGSRYRGGDYELLPHSIVDDGLLDVCVIGGEHPTTEVLRLTMAGEQLRLPGVRYARGREVLVERTDDSPLWFEHDGEVVPFRRREFTITVVPAAVAVLAAPDAESFGHSPERGLRSYTQVTRHSFPSSANCA